MTTNPPFPKFPEQDENGVDLSIIRENLRLPLLKRYEKNFNAMRSMVEMRRTFRNESADMTNSSAAKAEWMNL
jgi:hypothetical protein